MLKTSTLKVLLDQTAGRKPVQVLIFEAELNDLIVQALAFRMELPGTVDADEANALYGEAYGVDWEYRQARCVTCLNGILD